MKKRAKVKPTADGAVNRLARGAHEAVDKVARGAVPAINRAAKFAHKVVDRADNGASSAADWLGKQAEDFPIDQEKLLKETRKYIEKNPLKAVGAALAIGILIARIIR